MATGELLIFLHAVLPELDRRELVQRLRMLPGVLTVRLDSDEPGTRQLAYDTKRIQAEEILSAVRQRDPQASVPAL